MSTPNDPYLQTPSQSVDSPGHGASGYPAAPPAPPLPGQAPPPGGFAQPGWAASPPTGLAMATIVTTGLYLLVQLITAATAQSSVEAAKDSLVSGDTTIDVASTVLQALGGVIGLASFIMLALWMSRIRSNLAKRGVKAGGPPHVEWWGWFVPLANFVLPFLGMKAIAHRKVGMGVLLGWWLPWCLVWIMSIAASMTSFFAVDFATGEIDNADALDASVPLTYVAAAAIIVSWIFLTVIVRRVTARHLED
ncbi:DUF4328 domain-containing protein [Demequina aurantiaca]|uniref:DUF4328 domain-containing protein n=1 Tax=Demequina aurantiaca TaxID=676200 RepID=UPI003D336FEE